MKHLQFFFRMTLLTSVFDLLPYALVVLVFYASIPIGIFFILHWYLSLFSQSFFMHRYAAHGHYKMPKWFENLCFYMSILFQGSSCLNTRTYALLHRLHHKHSDHEGDPHSPTFFTNIFSMMWKTKNVYLAILKGRYPYTPDPKELPPPTHWVENIGDMWFVRLSFVVAYSIFYYYFVPQEPYHYLLYLLLPIHWVMSPVHGALVNWCGHKYGYRNFKSNDHSENTTPLDLTLAGERFQNNHHELPHKPNFGVKWFEFDLTYWIVVKPLLLFGLIKLNNA